MAAELTSDQLAATPRLQGDALDGAANKASDILASLGSSAEPEEIREADALEGGPVADAAEDQTDTAATVTDESGDAAGTEEVEETVVGASETEQGAEDDGSPTLPGAYRRSLAAYGWTPEEIEARLAADPDGFMADAERLHMRRVHDTQQWAAEGQKRRQEEQDGLMPEPTQPAGRTSPESAFPDGGIADIDFKALSDESGLPEESLRKMFAPVVNAADAINQVLPTLQEGVQHIQQSRDEQLAREIDTFFQGDDLKSFVSFYGNSWDSVTEQQVEHRNKVLELADALVVGAGAHGRNLSAMEAMELAHASVSSEFNTEAAREEIRGQVKKRAKSVTLRPSSKAAPKQTGEPTRDQALANAAEGLRALFN